jgi:hypothetical protein
MNNMNNIKPSDMNILLSDKLSFEDVDFVRDRYYMLKVGLPYRKLKDIVDGFSHNEPDDEDIDLIRLLINHCNIIDNELWIYFKKGIILEYVGHSFSTPEFKIEGVYVKISIFYPLKFEKYSDIFEKI